MIGFDYWFDKIVTLIACLGGLYITILKGMKMYQEQLKIRAERKLIEIQVRKERLELLQKIK